MGLWELMTHMCHWLVKGYLGHLQLAELGVLSTHGTQHKLGNSVALPQLTPCSYSSAHLIILAHTTLTDVSYSYVHALVLLRSHYSYRGDYSHLPGLSA